MTLAIGIEIAGSEIRWTGVSQEENGTLTVSQMPDNKVPMPTASASPGANLQTLVDLVRAYLSGATPDYVAIVRADHNSGVDRAKMEAALQLATNVLGI